MVGKGRSRSSGSMGRRNCFDHMCIYVPQLSSNEVPWCNAGTRCVTKVARSSMAFKKMERTVRQ